jgi:hypothetical protein
MGEAQVERSKIGVVQNTVRSGIISIVTTGFSCGKAPNALGKEHSSKILTAKSSLGFAEY